MTNLDKKKRNIASRMMDIKHPKKHDGPNPVGSISTVSHLRRIADKMTGKHVEVNHKKHSLAF